MGGRGGGTGNSGGGLKVGGKFAAHHPVYGNVKGTVTSVHKSGGIVGTITSGGKSVPKVTFNKGEARPTR